LRIVVIGAGIVGAAVAASLTRRGAQVTILEARHPGSGTTATSFAWVNSANKDPESYFALNHAGVRAHHEFAGQRTTPWFFPTGNMEWAVSDEHRAALSARMEKLRARGYPARWITAGQARELEPDLICPPDADYAFFPEEAHVLPALLLSRLLGEAKDGGARIRYRAAVTEITTDAVHTEDGQRHPADIVVSCAGRWTAQVAQLAGAHVPMLETATPGSTTVGLLTTTAAQPARLSRVLTTSALNVRPDGGGRLLLQALDLDQHADPGQPPSPGDPLPGEVVRRLTEVLSGTEGTVAERVQVGRRAMPADGRTVAGFAEGAGRFYVLATHSGITLAPLLAELATQELYGADAAMLRDFRPDRFTAGAPFEALQPARRPGEQ